MSPDNTPQAVVACHDLLAWIIPQLDKFPRVRGSQLNRKGAKETENRKVFDLQGQSPGR